MAALAFEPRVNGRLLRSVLNPHKPVTLAHKLGLLMYILIFPVAVLCDAALECSVVAQRAWHATGLLYAPLLLGNVALRWATRTPFDARALLRCLVFLGPQRAARPAPAVEEKQAQPAAAPRPWWNPPPRKDSRPRLTPEQKLEEAAVLLACFSASSLASHLMPLLPQRGPLGWVNPVDTTEVDDWRSQPREPPPIGFFPIDMPPSDAPSWYQCLMLMPACPAVPESPPTR